MWYCLVVKFQITAKYTNILLNNNIKCFEKYIVIYNEKIEIKNNLIPKIYNLKNSTRT
jgi:hypothetical protein